METRESEVVEFKKTTSEIKEGVISLASMLNKHKCGTLYFGVKNDGSIFGQQIGESTTADISKAIKNNLKPRITPQIEVINEQGKDIIKVVVRGEDVPYSAYDRYYIRSDDEDLIMTNTQLEQFFLNKNYDYSKWEKQDSGVNYEEIDEDLLIQYVNKGNDSGRINFLYKDSWTTLSKLKLLCGDNLNNAGYYLFSNRKPLLLKLAIYPTDERVQFTDMKHFRGNIFECIEEAVSYVANNIHWSAKIVGIDRIETPEVPMEAFREIIVNSFAHMYVNEVSSNEIYITPTRIHIYNPGSLVPGTTPEMFAERKQGSMIRNPLIATTLYYNKTIDAFGTGFERVFNLCKDIGYQYNDSQFGFTFEFLRSQHDTINDTINDTITKLSKDERIIYELIKTGNRYSKSQLASELHKSDATVSRIIKNLTERNYIERIGSKKTGYWKVKE